MEKQKSVLQITLILIILFVLLTPMISFATNETEEIKVVFHTKTNTDIYNLGENVKVNVGWKSYNGDLMSYDVQAIGFTLQYDKSKLEFVDATFYETTEDGIKEKPLEKDFYNDGTPGTLILSKISLNNLSNKGISLNFKTTAIGEANIQLTEVDCVSDGNLVSPDVIDFNTNSLATIKTVAFGDVDLNGKLENADSDMLKQYLEGRIELNEQQLENANVNLDEIIDNVDIQLIRKCLESIIDLPIRYGDASLDCSVDVYDASLILQYYTGIEGKTLTQRAWINADTNLDGVVNEFDAWIIMCHVVGMDYGLPFRMIKNSNLKCIDRESLHMITGFDLEKQKVSELLENFNTNKGFQVCNVNNEILENEDTFSTGTKIKIGGNGSDLIGSNLDGSKRYWMAEYNVVMYGDTTGDGKINAIDALALIKHLNGAIPFTSEVFIEAGRIVCEDGAEPTAVDALAIIRHANKKELISQTK